LSASAPDNPDLELEAIRAAEIDLEALQKRPPTKPPRRRRGEPFLKGPIPWRWLEAAMRLPGRALHVGVLLWKEAGCRKSRTVRLRLTVGPDYGIHPDTLKRGLRALRQSALVTVRHRPGRALEVTLLDAPAPKDPERCQTKWGATWGGD
jgi:hypothetical protein